MSEPVQALLVVDARRGLLAGPPCRLLQPAPLRTCGRYLDDIPAAVSAQVAEHAQGDQRELVASTADLTFGH